MTLVLEFKGPPDPLRGDEIYKRVREAAKVISSFSGLSNSVCIYSYLQYVDIGNFGCDL